MKHYRFLTAVLILLLNLSACQIGKEVEKPLMQNDKAYLNALSLGVSEFVESDASPSIQTRSQSNFRAYKNDEYFAFVNADTNQLEILEQQEGVSPSSQTALAEAVLLEQGTQVALDVVEGAQKDAWSASISNYQPQEANTVLVTECWQGIPTGAYASIIYQQDGSILQAVFQDAVIPLDELEASAQEFKSDDELRAIAYEKAEDAEILADKSWDWSEGTEDPYYEYVDGHLCKVFEIPVDVEYADSGSFQHALYLSIDCQSGMLRRTASTMN